MSQPGGTTFTDTGLPPNTQHTYRLRAVNNAGASEFVQLTTSTLQVSVGFVANLYPDLLGRGAGSADLTYWNGLLSNGLNHQDAALNVEKSDEFRTRQVNQAYNAFLKHPADATGLQFWSTKLANDVTYEQFKAELLGSDDYFVTRGNSTNEGTVTAMYTDLFGRVPNSSEVGYWSGQMAQQRRASVAYALETSVEGYSNIVNGYYRQVLHHDADSVGLGYWISQLQQGLRDEQLIASLVNSDEYETYIQAH